MKLKKSKKGVSLMIAYIILVGMSIAMSIIVYNYLKSYVPREPPECPDGISVFLENISCNSEQLNITLKNNGRFDIIGFFIYGSEDEDAKIATIDLSPNATYLQGGDNSGNAIIYQGGFSAGARRYITFNVTDLNIKFIEIIPARVDLINGKKRFLACTNAKIKENTICS